MGFNYLPQGQLPDWKNIGEGGQWWMVSDALKQQKQHDETRQRNMEIADMFKRQQEEMHPLEMAAKQASTRNINATAATSEDALAAQLPIPERQAAARVKNRDDVTKEQAAALKHHFDILEKYAALAQQGLAGLMQVPEQARPFAAQLSTPEGQKRFFAAKQQLNQLLPSYTQAVDVENIQQKGATARHAAGLKAQGERAAARNVPTDPFANIEKKISSGRDIIAAARNGIYLVDQIKSTLSEDAPDVAKTILDLNARRARYEKILNESTADRRLAVEEAATAKEGAAAAGVGDRLRSLQAAAQGRVNPGTTPPIQPNPAAALPNKTSEVRDATKSFSSEDEAQRAGAAGAFERGDTIYIRGKPVKVE